MLVYSSTWNQQLLLETNGRFLKSKLLRLKKQRLLMMRETKLMHLQHKSPKLMVNQKHLNLIPPILNGLLQTNVQRIYPNFSETLRVQIANLKSVLLKVFTNLKQKLWRDVWMISVVVLLTRVATFTSKLFSKSEIKHTQCPFQLILIKITISDKTLYHFFRIMVTTKIL